MPATFKPTHYGLRPIRIELMAGCIYAALTDEVPDFTPFRSQVAPFLEPYRLANAKVAFQSRLVERANWKLVMENARECYHCPTGHPELRVAFPVTFGRGFEYRGDPAHLKTFESRIAELGLPSMPVRGSWWNAARYPLNPGMESLTMNGASVVRKRLVEIDEKILGGVRWAIEPNNFCHALPDYAFMFSAVPIGAEETHVLSTWLVHKDAVEGKDYTIDSLTELWTKTNLQDRALSENNQKGVNGFGYSPGPYSEDAEHFVIEFVNWYRAAAQAATRDG
jgi:Rieske 2Fe-2S family protein